jgi:hypothetical protein
LNKGRLLIALLIGSVFGALTMLMIQSPDSVGAGAIFLFPGAVLGIIASGNVHDFRPWVVALGNFTFYFGVVYVIWGVWERHTRKVDSGKEP